MSCMHAIEPRGIAGGLCVFWRDAQDVVLIKYGDFFIEVLIEDGVRHLKWRLVVVYACTDERKRAQQFENDGGTARSMASMRVFRNFVVHASLLDLGFEGYPYTWRNRREEGFIQERLDRVLATHEWVHNYQQAVVKHVVLEGSDHAMLVLSTEVDQPRRKKRFMYDPRWSQDPKCDEVKNEGRNEQKEICRLKEALREAYQQPVYDGNRIRRLEEELTMALRREEIFWRTKSRVQWLKEGDKNTRFFHAQTLKRHRQNMIRGLEAGDGTWCTDATQINSIAVDYFTSLFTMDRPLQFGEILQCVPTRVGEVDNAMLVAPVTDGEIEAAIYQMHPTKSPGPDGFNAGFYHHHWETVGAVVLGMVKSFFVSGRMLEGVNHTNIVLIPKVTNPRNMGHFRPISLCNVVYKIISKVLTNRLKRVLPKVISPNQSAFVAGRQISDNILVVHELLHFMQHGKEDGVDYMAMKLDMAKAYDRVEWAFLNAMLLQLGFDDMFCQWVMACVKTVSYNVVVNGETTGYIKPRRGIRQGDPLSPFLFLICAEGFTSLLHNAEEMGRLRGMSGEAHTIKGLLQQYAVGSGQFINLDKSSVHFSMGCSKALKEQLSQILGIKHQEGFGKYLGIQVDFGASKKKVFEEVRNRLDERINGWAEQFLSMAGKEVLIKSVAAALPVYTMSCFQLPIHLAKEIEQVIARFWWRDQRTKKGIHWMTWNKVAKKKVYGGLGFREIIDFNLAMLAKVGWRLISNPGSILARVLQAKYYHSSSFLDAPVGRGTSWGWKGILQGRKILKAGVRWRVGDGTCIQIGKDPWLPIPRTFRPTSRHEEMPIFVADLVDMEGMWKREVIELCFSEDEAKTILSMPISRFGCPDRVVWHYTRNGVYSVKSGYIVAQEMNKN
ncbi:hypothetical protein ACFX2I_015708 [Malus domestica]